MALTLKIWSMTINRHPYPCPECATEGFTLDGRGLDGFPAHGNCPNGCHWEDPLITVGVMRNIQQARTGRAKAEDIDTFEIVIGGALIAGVLHPEVNADDIRRAVRDVYWRRIIKPAIRRRKNAAKRAVTRPVKNGARNAVAHAKAAALGAVWDLQAGGHQPNPDHTPEPVNPCPACNGNGHHAIDSRIHAATRVDCTVCVGTGEID